jgi:hypothetical protein
MPARLRQDSSRPGMGTVTSTVVPRPGIELTRSLAPI